MNKKIVILGGGTVVHVRNHLSLSATAYGGTAQALAHFCEEHPDNKMDIEVILTKMAQASSTMETIEDVRKRVDQIIADPLTKIVFFNLAMVDFKGVIEDGTDTQSGKYSTRLSSSKCQTMTLHPTEKVISSIRKERKDIFLVGFKTTCGASSQEQYTKGLRLLKSSSCNLVLANDTKTHNNMIITPEEAAYDETRNRNEALRSLVNMAIKRSHLMFTRSTVVAGESIPWKSDLVPDSLRVVVDHCIDKGAYKVLKINEESSGSTVGHFAVKLNEKTFLTSKRKTNFNNLNEIGLVKVVTDGPDNVTAYGFKPSVGGQSQRLVFAKFEEHKLNCIVHFHCEMKKDAVDIIPIRSQKEYECGSHECGKNTADGLTRFGNIWAVMLDKHGPNIVFNSEINPQFVIDFIDRNFDLNTKTGGYQLEKQAPKGVQTGRYNGSSASESSEPRTT